MAELEKFNLECLDRVNELRRLFKFPPVKLRLSLIQRPSVVQVDSYSGAQDWADNLACNDVLLSDSDAARYEVGESICRLFSEKFCAFSGRAVINTWFDEATEYLRNDSICTEKIYSVNFLQLIWPHVRYCGFGFSVSQRTSAMYTVARFKPMLPMNKEVLTAWFTQQVPKFDSVNGLAAFSVAVMNNLSQDVSYVKRNLFCSIPKGPTAPVETINTMAQRYRLSHMVQQTEVRSRDPRHFRGFVYVNEQIDKTNDTIIIMQQN